MNLISISSLKDNYIWILVDKNNQCLIVDPGEDKPVFNAIKKNKWTPKAILLTHHHSDHVNGVLKLRTHFPYLTVYGPKEIKNNILTNIIQGGETLLISNWKFSVFATPGHTKGHLCFFYFPYLFCGDTLFSGGCGRIFEGTYKQMYQSLKKINQLPDDTLICCAHEYTLENMKFSINILPNDPFIKKYYSIVNKLRKRNQKTLPITLKNERKINLFLRINDTNLIKEISKKTDLKSEEECFRWLRLEKDNF